MNRGQAGAGKDAPPSPPLSLHKHTLSFQRKHLQFHAYAKLSRQIPAVGHAEHRKDGQVRWGVQRLPLDAEAEGHQNESPVVLFLHRLSYFTDPVKMTRLHRKNKKAMRHFSLVGANGSKHMLLIF